MTFVILTGGIDLSVGSILAASAMAALIASLIPDWGMLGIPAALLTGLLFGLINGSLIAFVRLPPFIVTLGSLTAVRGLARLMGSDTTVFNPDLPFAFIGNAVIPVAPGFGIPVARHHRDRGDPGVLVRAASHRARHLDLRRRRQPGGGTPVGHQGLAHPAVRLCRLRPARRARRRDVGGAALRRERPAARRRATSSTPSQQ